MKKEFLDLGKHPIANAFLKEKDFNDEFFFNLKVCLDTTTKLVSIKNFVAPEKIFNEEYPYNTSNSVPMVKHFKQIAKDLKDEFNPKTILEIGSNDGPFISNFDTSNSICVEPCGNFSKKTELMGYTSYTEFWTTKLSEQLKQQHGQLDLIYAANCICHIHDLDDAFNGIANLLSDDGIFVFEDPSLLKILQRGSYDQIYDEHPHIFSVTALDNILKKHNLTIFRVDNLSVHGGSNRIYVSKNKSIENSVTTNLVFEDEFGINDFTTYKLFAERVNKSKQDLVKLLKNIKQQGKKIICIGATAKSTTVFNYCKIGPDLIDLITDTTKDKQNMYAPGSHIPIVPRESVNINDYDYAYLGAWNFKDFIANNETEFVKSGGKFITHIPNITVF
tara:strand:- start:775 stop:1944 length:1170 start_codon:yes stop_codon:yes gene_type:complete